MHSWPLPLQPRFIVYTAVLLITAILLVDEIEWFPSVTAAILLVPFVALAVLGTVDVLQKRHAVLRNYPLTAHIRFILEEIRPEIRQYFLESEKDGTPFSRDQRAIVYQRAKHALDKRPFGTQNDVYASGYEWLQHSIAPKSPAKEPFRILVGGPDCAKPYSASILNISAMSFGALSASAIRALNIGARNGGFAHDTGEGGYSPYHRENGGDIIWEIGSGYFSCRNADGTFCAEKFEANADNDQVKMVELKLSQGAKPGHGGVLPAAKVSPEIALTRGVPVGIDCISPSRHSAFATPIELMQFIATMRKLSGGKPTGFKLCIGHPWEFLAICKAMLETEIYPDFIVVDGKEGGTGAAPPEFTDHLGMPLREGLNFVHNALVGINARDRVKIGASAKIISAFDMARVRDGARRRLVQFGARLHVRARLHPVAVLPYRPLPDRSLDAGQDAPARARRSRQVRARAQFPSRDAGGAGRIRGGGGPRPSGPIRAGAFFAAGVAARSENLRRTLSAARARRADQRLRRQAL
jgi:glutamate synthase domain-containing protein 2